VISTVTPYGYDVHDTTKSVYGRVAQKSAVRLKNGLLVKLVEDLHKLRCNRAVNPKGSVYAFRGFDGLALERVLLRVPR
jgi:hypothetical protein